MYVFLSTYTVCSSSQLLGTWKLAEIPGALKVGPSANNLTWWVSSSSDIITRNCLFDDSITFDANGNMIHYMDGSTWLEPFQGVSSGQCGNPVAPHVGGQFTYLYSNNQLTVNGVGAHLGLAQTYNGGELSIFNNNIPNSRTYNITFNSSGDTLTADISFGTGTWRFTYCKTVQPPPPPAVAPVVTFSVHTDSLAGLISSDGIFIGGGFVGAHNALPLSDSNGDGIWEGTMQLDTNGGLFYIFNGDCVNYDCVEDISGQSCVDSNGLARNNLINGFNVDTTLHLQFGSCDFPSLLSPQLTYVPDDDFENYLESLGYGNNILNDDYVLTSYVQSLDSINPHPVNSNGTIQDLTGLQDFTSLRVLNLMGNGVLGLNGNIESKIPSLPNLEWLYVDGTAYDTLDVSNLPNLKNVSARQIGVVQALGGISSRLKFLNISNSQNIETINLGGNSGVNISNLLNLNSLETLILDNVSSISGVLDLSNLSSLETLNISNDNVNNLVLNNNLNLEYLNCSNNSLGSLDLSNNPNIEYLDCSENTLVYIDLSNNPNIDFLDCNTSNVICLNLKNGNNLNMSFIDATGNPTLSCIDVDDSLVSTAIWIPGSNYSFDNYSFSNNCGLPCSGFVAQDTCTYSDTNFVIIYDTVVIYDTLFTQVFDSLTIYDTTYISISVIDTLYIDITVTGVPNLNNTISVYPNPAYDVVIIDNGNYNIMSNYSLVIINSLSQQVFSSQINTQQFQIPVSTLGAEGTYFIQIFDGNNNLVTTKYLVLN